MLGEEKPLSLALSEIKKSSFISDSKNSIIDALESLKAFSKKSCVSSNELFKKSNISSRVKFNGQLNFLEQSGKIKSLVDGNERRWHLKK